MADLKSTFKSKSGFFYIILIFAAAKLILHLVFLNGYGIFRDELYYIACGSHLDFGYVDHPPFVALVAWFSGLFGDSIFWIRIFPILAGVSLVVVTGLIVRELGGGRLSLVLACTAVLFSPIILAVGSFLSMNVFDHLFWTLLIYLIIMIIKTDEQKYWLWAGVVTGVGLMNKISMLFLLFGLFIGFVLTSKRKYFIDKNLWYAVIIGLLIFLPNIIWQIVYGFPTLEFIHNASVYKNVHHPPMIFLMEHFKDTHLLAVPLLLIGMYYLLFDIEGKKYRASGFVYPAVLLLLMLTGGKTYYLGAAIPFMFAAGAVGLEKILGSLKFKAAAVYSYAVLISAGGAVMLPLALPVLPPGDLLHYMDTLGIRQRGAEKSHTSELPQIFADRFGWENMAKNISDAYMSLSEKERENCVVVCNNYGEAGSIDYYRKKYPLPQVVCGHNNYYYWKPENIIPSVYLVMDDERGDLDKLFEEVEEAGVIISEYAMPEETGLTIFICKRPLFELDAVWEKEKHFI